MRKKKAAKKADGKPKRVPIDPIPFKTWKIKKLPPDLKEQLDQMLTEGTLHSCRQLSKWLGDNGFEISHAAIHKYGQKFERRLAAIKMATEQARIVFMLDGHPELTLAFLNEATQAWVEIAYHRALHRELACTPVERFAQAADVLRPSPASDVLRQAFRLEASRRQRHSDGTISLAGVRFEVPARFRHFREVVVRYARWDLSRVDLVDPRHGTLLAPLYPLDRAANADGRRAVVEPARAAAAAAEGPRSEALPPLLQKILADYSATGLPPAYLPQSTSNPQEGEHDHA